ncbi:hypothetical protein TruAng_007118 [Truncatella angustata]|nr:hypothetical protein TruAng_007118 [Truncatella angustata]
MALKRFILLVLAGAALAQMDGMGMGDSRTGVESTMPISSSAIAETAPMATEAAQSTAVSTPYSNYSSAIVTTNSSLSLTDGDYSSTMAMGPEATPSLLDPLSTTTADYTHMSDMSHATATTTGMTTMSTSVLSMDMPMGTNDMTHGNASATGTIPISGSEISGVSLSLFVASALLGALVLI